jgi:hypothetical protein
MENLQRKLHPLKTLTRLRPQQPPRSHLKKDPNNQPLLDNQNQSTHIPIYLHRSLQTNATQSKPTSQK